MFKALTIALIILMTPPTMAKWDGFYVNGSVAVSSLDDPKAIRIPINFGGGYGAIIPGYFSHGMYLGMGVDLIDCHIALSDSILSHHVTTRVVGRLGFPNTTYMPYGAVLLGYNYSEAKGGLGLRSGIDFDFIVENFFWGLHLDVFSLNSKIQWQSGFVFGYRF